MNSTTASVAKVLILDSAHNALVLTIGKHLAHPEKSFTPDLPGGLVEPGESEQLAAIRETAEETGIILNPKDVWLAYAQTTHHPKEGKSVTKLLYMATIDKAPSLTLSREHSDFAWVPLNQLLQTVTFRPFYREAIEYLLTNKFL